MDRADLAAAGARVTGCGHTRSTSWRRAGQESPLSGWLAARGSMACGATLATSSARGATPLDRTLGARLLLRIDARSLVSGHG